MLQTTEIHFAYNFNSPHFRECSVCTHPLHRTVCSCACTYSNVTAGWCVPYALCLMPYAAPNLYVYIEWSVYGLLSGAHVRLMRIGLMQYDFGGADDTKNWHRCHLMWDYFMGSEAPRSGLECICTHTHTPFAAISFIFVSFIRSFHVGLHCK